MRRRVIRTSLMGGSALLTGTVFQTGVASADVQAANQTKSRLTALIVGLRSIGNPECVTQADKLDAFGAPQGDYDLHLRDAGLSLQHALAIAQALREVSSTRGPSLRSFSLSFNPGLTDAGVVAIAEALPSTVTELGIVQCAIGDESGEALWTWAQQAPNLRMLCAEGNQFSKALRQRFTGFGRRHDRLLVVI